MKHTILVILSVALFLLSSCSKSELIEPMTVTPVHVVEDAEHSKSETTAEAPIQSDQAQQYGKKTVYDGTLDGDTSDTGEICTVDISLKDTNPDEEEPTTDRP